MIVHKTQMNASMQITYAKFSWPCIMHPLCRILCCDQSDNFLMLICEFGHDVQLKQPKAWETQYQ